MDVMKIMSLNRVYNEMVLHHNRAIQGYGRLDEHAYAYYKSQFDRVTSEMRKFGYDIQTPDLSRNLMLPQI